MRDLFCRIIFKIEEKFLRSRAVQVTSVFPASIDSVVATVYAALGATKGADPVVMFGSRANFGGTLGFGNISPTLLKPPPSRSRSTAPGPSWI